MASSATSLDLSTRTTSTSPTSTTSATSPRSSGRAPPRSAARLSPAPVDWSTPASRPSSPSATTHPLETFVARTRMLVPRWVSPSMLFLRTPTKLAFPCRWGGVGSSSLESVVGVGWFIMKHMMGRGGRWFSSWWTFTLKLASLEFDGLVGMVWCGSFWPQSVVSRGG